jgi:hypothetical protein
MSDTTRYFLTAPDLPPALWSVSPERFRAALLAAEGVNRAEPYFEHLYILGLYLVLEAPAGRPSTAQEFLTRLAAVELAKAWGGQVGVSPWTGHVGADQLIAAVLDGKQPVLNSLMAQCHNMFRLWSTDPAALRSATTAAGIDLDPAQVGFRVDPDRLRALRHTITAGRARFGRVFTTIAKEI